MSVMRPKKRIPDRITQMDDACTQRLSRDNGCYETKRRRYISSDAPTSATLSERTAAPRPRRPCFFFRTFSKHVGRGASLLRTTKTCEKQAGQGVQRFPCGSAGLEHSVPIAQNTQRQPGSIHLHLGVERVPSNDNKSTSVRREGQGDQTRDS